VVWLLIGEKVGGGRGRLAVGGFLVNLGLFTIKLTAGILSNSLALVSDAFNSLLDVFSSTVVYIAVRVSSREADEGHPFGHHRAEPISGLVVAIFAGVLGFEIIKTGLQQMQTNRVDPNQIGFYAVMVLVISIITKTVVSTIFYNYAKKNNSPGLMASAIDSRNDVLVSAVVLFGVLGALRGWPKLDSLAAIAVGIFILWSGYSMGMENIGYLMGKAPEKPLIARIESEALKVSGVLGVENIRAHYVGNYIHVEIQIRVDGNIPISEAHEIGREVEERVESLEEIDKCFIHLEPVDKDKNRV